MRRAIAAHLRPDLDPAPLASQLATIFDPPELERREGAHVLDAPHLDVQSHAESPRAAIVALPVAMVYVRAIRGAPYHASFANSRSLNFCTFPVDVFGTSVNTMWRGAL